MAMKVKMGKKKCSNNGCFKRYRGIALFSAIFLVIGTLITILSTTVGTTGHAAYGADQAVEDGLTDDASVQAEIYAREETTKDGLIVKYDILEQGPALWRN